MKKIKASIVGGSGYGGSELLRFLLYHPNVDIVSVTSRTHAGQNVGSVHKNLSKLTELKFENADVKGIAEKSDVVFFAMPHGAAMEMIPAIIKKTKIIDLSGDFRLNNLKDYEEHYNFGHKSPHLLNKFVYGLTEINKNLIKNADNIACPGCFPTGALLALAPLAKKGLLPKYIAIDSKTGSSGSGSIPSAATHHPSRANNIKAYKVLSHQHEPEIKQELAKIDKNNLSISFVAHSVPAVRGIFTTVHFLSKKEISSKELRGMFTSYYKDSFFVRIMDDSPESSFISGTNFADIGVFAKGKKVVVASAIDNLVKGASGQAIQNMNLMFGLDEKTGLQFPGMHP